MQYFVFSRRLPAAHLITCLIVLSYPEVLVWSDECLCTCPIHSLRVDPYQLAVALGPSLHSYAGLAFYIGGS